MKQASTDSETFLDRIRSWARTKAHGPSPLSSDTRRSPVLPLTNQHSNHAEQRATELSKQATNVNDVPPFPSTDANGLARQSSKRKASKDAMDMSGNGTVPAPSSEAEGQGTVISQVKKKNIAKRFFHTTKDIVLSSWINVLLVFVPVGIAAKAANLNPTVIFAMNAIAIIPLAGLLSHATESVAKRMGDTIGALMNVTFGNAVELIIFIIALAKNEIRIVQASLLGSILANLLLILGMCFLIGGLRFREQIYNSTVTQMSACLLSLSVMSLLLPTAFHASFDTSASDSADVNVLKVSRGTSVVLLLVYLLYLVFQLKSHAYMYESTPQHIIDEESAPGPVAAWMDSSSSSDDSSSSSDSDGSSRSNTTARRIKRVMRGARRNRKTSAGSRDTDDMPKRKGSCASGASSPVAETVGGPSNASLTSDAPHRFGAIDNDEEADDESQHKPRRSRGGSFTEKFAEKFDRKQRKKDRKNKKRHGQKQAETQIVDEPSTSIVPETKTEEDTFNEPRRVDFAVANDAEAQTVQKKPFGIGVLNLRPTIPKTFSQTVFSQPARSGSPQIGPAVASGPVPRVRYGIRRTNSLPDRLNQQGQPQREQTRVPSMGTDPAGPPILTDSAMSAPAEDENISRTTAVFLLLISTGLVAICAEFMVDSIQDVTTDTSLGETFVGLIILPIVGNAAEHVTAVSVASKNKMDLAIGVAVGSSIQIALFVTPFVVLLGWIMDKEMSLYFTLFETVSLFVSAFIVNFLVLDGRSNYLEGALLCSAYVIIAVAAFFYPSTGEQSVLGGNAEAGSKMIRSLLGFN